MKVAPEIGQQHGHFYQQRKLFANRDLLSYSIQGLLDQAAHIVSYLSSMAKIGIRDEEELCCIDETVQVLDLLFRID